MVSVVIKGLKELQRELADDFNDINKGIRQAIVETAYEIHNDAKKSLNEGGKSGRVYQKYKPRRTHRASAKGQAPATDTGRLVNSIEVDEQIGLKARVIAGARYAGFLEEDLDRPYMKPAYENNMGFLDREISKAIDKALR